MKKIAMLLVLVAIVVPPVFVNSANAQDICNDGEVLGNDFVDGLTRIPVGLAENAVVVEVALRPGSGFGRWDRFILVLEASNNLYQVFLNNVDTIHSVRYCGTFSEVQSYAALDSTHVRAMQVSAADHNGNTPNIEEIGVYAVDLSNAKFRILNAAPLGPTPQEVLEHIEVVRINGTTTSSTGNIVSQTQQQSAAPAINSCAFEGLQLGDGTWRAQNVTVTGQGSGTIVNVGFPSEGVQQYRVLVDPAETVTFIAAAGNGYNFFGCSASEIQANLNNGSLPVKTVEQLIAEGKASR